MTDHKDVEIRLDSTGEALGFGLSFAEFAEGPVVAEIATGGSAHKSNKVLRWQLVEKFDGQTGLRAEEMNKFLEQAGKTTVQLKVGREPEVVLLTRSNNDTSIGLKFARFPDGFIKIAQVSPGSAAQRSDKFARGQVVYEIEIDGKTTYEINRENGTNPDQMAKKVEDQSVRELRITLGRRPVSWNKFHDEATFVGEFQGVDEFLEGIEGQIGRPFADIERGMDLELARDARPFTASNNKGCEFTLKDEYSFVARDHVEASFVVPGFREGLGSSKPRYFVPLKIFLYATCARTLGADSQGRAGGFGGRIPSEIEPFVLSVLLRRVREAVLTKDTLKAAEHPSLQRVRELAQLDGHGGEEQLSALQEAIQKAFAVFSAPMHRDKTFGLPSFYDVAEEVFRILRSEDEAGAGAGAAERMGVSASTQLSKIIDVNALKALAELAREKLRDAGLIREEIIGLRLYTGPLFVKMNGALRGEKFTGGVSREKYTNTIFAATSGMVKLSKVTPIPPGRSVYRGISGLQLPERFWNTDTKGVRGGVEKAFMSTTTNRNVAIEYCNPSEAGKMPFIFEIQVGAIDNGAALGFLSQFPEEDEILMPPRSFLEVLGKPEKIRIDSTGARSGVETGGGDQAKMSSEEGGKVSGEAGLEVLSIPVRINCNVQNVNIANFASARKTLLLSTVDQAIMEVREELSRIKTDRNYLALATRPLDLDFAKAPQVQVVAAHGDFESLTEPGELVDRIGKALGANVGAQTAEHADRNAAVTVIDLMGDGSPIRHFLRRSSSLPLSSMLSAAVGAARVIVLVMTDAVAQDQDVARYCHAMKTEKQTTVFAVLSPQYRVKDLSSWWPQSMSWLHECQCVDLRSQAEWDLRISTELVPFAQQKGLLTRQAPEHYLLDLIKAEVLRKRDSFANLDADWFNEDFNFRMSMQEALNLHSSAMAKLNLYIAEPSRGLRWICDLPLRSCFRLLVGSKRRQMSAAKDRKDDRECAGAAADLCKMSHAARGRSGIEQLVLDSHAHQQKLFTWTPLMLAAADGDTEHVRLLLAAKAQPDKSDDDQGRTALRYAAEYGCVRVVCVLLEHKASPLCVDRNGASAFLRASENGHLKVLHRLHEQEPAVLNLANDVAYTPLMAAVRYSHTDSVAWLLERRADVNAVTNNTSHTALMLAALANSDDVVIDTLLLQHGADPQLCTTKGITPLLVSIALHNLARVRCLLAFGAQPERAVGEQDKHTPLALAEALRKVTAALLLKGNAPRAGRDGAGASEEEGERAWTEEDVREQREQLGGLTHEKKVLETCRVADKDLLKYVQGGVSACEAMVGLLCEGRGWARGLRVGMSVTEWSSEDVQLLLRGLGQSFEEAMEVVAKLDINGEDLLEYAALQETDHNPLYMPHAAGGLGLGEVQVRKLKRALRKAQDLGKGGGGERQQYAATST